MRHNITEEGGTEMKAAIIGATGYGGADLIRVLDQHPTINIHSIHTSSQEGKAIHEAYPHLHGVEPTWLEGIDPKRMKQEVDIVFTATPTGVSKSIVPQLIEEGLRVVDLSGDFRL